MESFEFIPKGVCSKKIIMDIENIKNRLRIFVKNHPEYSKNGFLQGIDESGKIVIIVNGQEKHITIDELENGHLNNNENVISFPLDDEKVETLDKHLL